MTKPKKREPVWTWTVRSRRVFAIHREGLRIFDVVSAGSDEHSARHFIAAKSACRALNAAERKGKK